YGDMVFYTRSAGGYNEKMRIMSDGNVGIGTTSPQYRLTIASSTALTDGAGVAQWVTRNAGGNLYFATTTVEGTATTSTSALTINGSTGAISIATSTTGCLQTTAAGLVYSASCAAGSDPSIGGVLTGATAGSVLFAGSGTFAQDNANFFWDDSNNRLGIGTTTPYAKLSVHAQYGTNNSAAPLFSIASSTDAATTTLFTVLANGNVGIGTSNPSALLEVQTTSLSGFVGLVRGDYVGTGMSDGYAQFGIVNNNQTANNYAEIAFSDNGGGGSPSAALGTIFTSHGSDYGDMVFYTRSAGGYNEKMRIMSDGNVGIGTTSPFNRSWFLSRWLCQQHFQSFHHLHFHSISHFHSFCH
ncbi:MAG: hypothetical protein Athens071424_44, partial [Parcubacteria group bacterium Athens0714_24]